MDQIDVKIQEIKEDMFRRIQEIIQINSVEGVPKERMPFGEGVDRALQYALTLSEELGFRVKNGEGYYGYAEMGEGEELIGILGHLDVVPEGDPSTWTYPPYGGEIHHGNIFGRGAVDDKGPTIAALYAMKIVKDLGFPIHKRVRMIFGTNEETRWEDMKRYKEREEAPSCGFTPDSDYPLIFAEKGLLQFQLVSDRGGNLLLTGGNAFNSVPDHCVLQNQDFHKIVEGLERLGCQYSKEEERLIVKGRAAHSAKAWKGINAIVKMAAALYEAGVRTEAVDFIVEMIGEDCYAEKIVGDCQDEPSGRLTFNVAKIDLNDEQQVIDVDIRFPVTKDKEKIVEAVKAAAAQYGLIYREIDYLEPLYVPNEHPLVQMLRKVFEEETGLDSTPIATGGATYARVFKNFVAFGPLFPGKEKMAHQKDEYIEMDTLIKSVKMYVKAIAELAK